MFFRDILEGAMSKFKQELIAAKNKWVKERTECMNVKDSVTFWKKYKRVFGAKQDNHICNLLDKDILLTSDADKEKVLFKEFFTGKHLENQQTDATHTLQMQQEYSALVA